MSKFTNNIIGIEHNHERRALPLFVSKYLDTKQKKEKFTQTLKP